VLLAFQSLGLAAGIPPLAHKAPKDGTTTPAPIPTKTVMRTFSSEASFSNPFGFDRVTSQRYEYTGTITRYEPLPTTFPALVTVVESTILTEFVTGYFGSFEVSSTIFSDNTITWVSSDTWSIAPPAATDATAPLPADADADAACSACGRPTAPPDPACEALGLQTGCDAAQCPRGADGMFWCRVMFPGMWPAKNYRNGRACWGNRTEYKQLLKPCLVGDGMVGCTACKGNLGDFFPKHWL